MTERPRVHVPAWISLIGIGVGIVVLALARTSLGS